MPDRESRGVLRALAALGALAAVVVGVPIVLVRLAHALPLDVGALAPGAWAHADDGRLLLLVILVVAWAAWASVVLSVAVESWSALRRVRTPALPGMAAPQRMAAALVAAVLVALSPTAGSGGPAVATPASTAASDLAARPGARAPGALALGAVSAAAQADEAEPGLRGSPVPRPAPASGAGLAADQAREDAARSRAGSPTVTTQRHDTLWMLAETYLGAGERFVEIVDLNRDVAQPEGRTLGDGGRVYPGWTLLMPADADLSADRPERHVVVPGDTLWEIAAEELGEPTLYSEIADANRGDLQPDGRRLGDPGLIIPGWVLEIPGMLSADEPPATSDEQTPSAQLPPIDRAARTGEAAPVVVPPLDRGVAERMAGDTSVHPNAAVPTGAVPTSADPTSAHPTPAVPSLATEAGATSGSSAPVASGGSSSASSPSSAAAVPPAWSGSPASSVSPASSGTSAPSPSAPPVAAEPGAPADHPDRTDITEGGFALRAGGFASVLLLAGVAAELARRRRQFQRHRRPGERMPIPMSAARRIETAARAAAHEPGVDLLDRALTALAENAERRGVAVPDVRIVRVTADTVILDLAAPASDPIAPFTVAHEARWVLDSALFPAGPLPTGPIPTGPIPAGLIPSTPTAAQKAPSGSTPSALNGEEQFPSVTPSAGRPSESHLAGPIPSETPDRRLRRALPGLVTLGFAGDQTVLLNLESVGMLAVTGEGEVLGDVLRGFAADLALGPASALTERLLCLADASIEEAVDPGSIGVERDAARTCAAILDAMRSAAGRPATAADPLLIVLSDRELDVRVPPSSGSALISSAPTAAAGATLVVREAGDAVLLPEGERLVLQMLSRRATQDVVDVLSAADLPDSEPADPVPAQAAPEIIDLREETSQAPRNSSMEWIQGVLAVDEPDADRDGVSDGDGGSDGDGVSDGDGASAEGRPGSHRRC